MTSMALAAVAYLQQQSTRFGDIYELERHDQALDEIVANLDRTAPTPFQTRSALANAAKVIRKRRAVRTFDSLDEPLPDGNLPDVGSVDESFALVEIHQWLDTSPSLRPVDRRVLRELACGEDAESLAGRYGLPVARMRERISRARSACRMAYSREVA
jgi:DNA-directed RNA polymerase specialized sigma24 family protein